MKLERLNREIRDTAISMELDVDVAAYLAAGRDPMDPILFAGSLEAPVAFVGRDLGRDEVALGQPLIGSAGRRVRRAVYEFLNGTEPPTRERFHSEALGHILLMNTVPYKPVGNKAYSAAVRERFRPNIAALICCFWRGSYLVTLGTEAFHWFSQYGPPGAFDDFWRREDRYTAQIRCEIPAVFDGKTHLRELTIAPLPHPSPLNRAYLAQFPALLRDRLEKSPLISAAGKRT